MYIYLCIAEHTNKLCVLGEKEFIAFTSDDRHFSMLRNLHMADYITLLNGFCGFMCVISNMRYSLTGDQKHIIRAMYLVPLGLFFDFMDGRVARWRNRSSLMGQELDSLADLISFGVGPATCGFSLGLQTTLDSVLLAFFVLCGLTRLARFNVTVGNIPKDKSGKSKYFEGTPIPTTLAIVVGISLCVYNGWIHDNIPGGILFEDGMYAFHPIIIVYILSGCAMISKSLKVPKI